MENKQNSSQISLILLIIALAAGPAVLGATRLWTFLPIFILLGIVFLFKLIEWKSSLLRNSWRPDHIDGFVFLFLIYASYLACQSIAPYEARLEWMKIFAYAGVFWVARYGIERRNQALLILGSIVVVALSVSAFAFFLKANPLFLPYGEKLHIHYAPRLTGTYGCPNHLGYFMVMAVSIAFAFGWFSRLPWITRILFLYSAGILLITLTLTLSRGSWLAFACAVLALTHFAVRLKKISKWIPIAGFIILVGGFGLAVAMIPALQQRLSEGFNPDMKSLAPGYVRVQLFYDSLKIHHDYPWTGTGPATFLYIHPRYQDPHYDTLAVFNHNDYLNVLTDYGMIGLLLALSFVITAAAKLARPPNPEAPWHDRIMQASAAAAMLALILHSFVDFNLHIPANALLFFTIIGLGLRETPSNANIPRIPWAKLLLLPALFLWITWSYHLQKTSRGYFPYWQMYRQGDSVNLDEAIATTLEAALADPDSGAVACYLGDLYRSKAAKNQDRAIRIPAALESIRWYQKAAKINPLDDTITLRLGMAHDLMERYVEAFLYYQLAIKHQPFSGYFWTELGSHFWRRGQLTKAQTAYEAALECPYQPSNTRATLDSLNHVIDEARKKSAVRH